jgi:hypothetical protein
MYENGNVEMLRMNKKYLKEMGSGLTEKAILGCNMWDEQEESEKKKYEDTIKRAIASHNEEECETWRVIHSPSCGDSKIYTRSTMKCIGSTETQHLFYVTIRNITADKEAYMKLAENEKKFRMASDQNNTFAWEFDIATKEMRPCSRCRKVLGFPEVMYNYPEPAIENGTFPEDYADMYREWHKRLETGEKGLEAVIPLTKDRIPFYVRYTAEFDENGRPYKAYGSATQVKDS